ncbi:MAG: hydroxymethylglutaryl-CoA lyase [Sediminibacterium sp.]|nr:hydroxymethylglutaryl-CoA lyase [Sediminibacterium sp.]MBX9780392.1 hydroxymethylglutaryl-CoA lyase [Chitinophagaceae bacterium]
MEGKKIIIEEQGLRDGMQTLAVIIPVEKKLAYINQLITAGLKRIQVASFVHPKIVPQMADAEIICSGLPAAPGVVFSGLVLNLKGIERAAKAGLKHVSISLSASDTHSRKNTNKSIEEAKVEFAEMVKIARQENITVRGGIQCAFGCRYEGKINEHVVYDLVQHHINCGVAELALADSTGMGNPAQIHKMMKIIQAISSDMPITLHLHNTENKGYANLLAAIDAGIYQFDTAFGGLGGCPFIEGATGNIATEDTVHMLHQMGHSTDIDIHKVALVSRDMEKQIGAPLPGLVYSLLDRADIKMI